MVHTSRSDGTSLVLLEAMACGLPVVGMAVGGIRELIENEHTGMLVEADDWEGLANEVIKLLQTPALLRSMGNAARERVAEHFNVLTNTRQTADLLQHVALSWKHEKAGRNNHMLVHAMNGND